MLQKVAKKPVKVRLASVAKTTVATATNVVESLFHS